MEQADHFTTSLKKYSAQIGIQLGEAQIAQFMTYLRQLKIWNEGINLTSIADDEHIIVKHFLDSLAGLKVKPITEGSTILDVGTGAGFPGIPFAIARPDLKITLLEPSEKKVSFLRSIVGILRLQRVHISAARLENFTKSEEGCIGKFDYVVTRALRPSILLMHASKILGPSGKCILYSTSGIATALIGKKWKVSSELKFELPQGLGQRVISLVEPVLTSSQ